jgi:hypothetical protein
LAARESTLATAAFRVILDRNVALAGSTESRRRAMSSRTRNRIALVTAVVALGVVALVLSTSTGLGAGLGPERRGASTAVPPPGLDYTKFSHGSAAHKQRECSSCHTFPSANWKEVRAKDAFPDVTEYPRHAACLECHRVQFFARERPAPQICSVCHVGVSPRFTARRPFPNPLDIFRASKGADAFVSDFRVSFPHAVHLDQFGETGGGESCANCHQTYQPQGKSNDEFATKPPKDLGDAFWLKKGTFQTWPSGHDLCFTCHVQEGTPVDCAMCHKRATPADPASVDFDPGRATAMGVDDAVVLERWRRRGSSATFRHEGGLHTDVKCTSCHDVSAMDTTDARTTKVRVASCSATDGCHATATVDEGGILNFELDKRAADATFRCEKCHLAFGTEPVPADHAAAIPKPKPPG